MASAPPTPYAAAKQLATDDAVDIIPIDVVSRTARHNAQYSDVLTARLSSTASYPSSLRDKGQNPLRSAKQSRDICRDPRSSTKKAVNS